MYTKIQRTKVKGTWVRTSSSRESEPDFYAMDPVVGLDEFWESSSSRNVTNPVDNNDGVAGTTQINAVLAGRRDSRNNPFCVSPRASSLAERPRRLGQQHSDHFRLGVNQAAEKESASTKLRSTVAISDISSCSSVRSLDAEAARPLLPLPRLTESSFFLQLPPLLANYVSSTGEDRPSFPEQDLSPGTKDELTFTSIGIASRANSATAGVDAGFTPQEQSFPCIQPQYQKLHSLDIASLAQLGKAWSHPALFDDEELGSFLRELDLEMAEDLIHCQISKS